MGARKIIYLLLSFLFLMGCTNKKGKTVDKDENYQLNIGVMSSMDYLPLAIAKEQGFFEQEGVDVTINKFYSANERDAALQSGNLDGTIIDYTGAAIQRAGGVKIKVASQCDGSFVLVGAKDSKVNSVGDLKGKRIAVSRNTVIDYCTDWALQDAGVALDEVDKVEINKIPLRLEMLRNGKIDATMLPDPFTTIALDGGNKNLIDIKDVDLRVTGIVFHDNVIADKEDAIKNFYRAYNLAIYLINTQPPSTFEELLVKEIGIPKELAPQVVFPNYTKAQLPQDKDLEKVEQWLKSKGLVAVDFDINSLIASGLIP